jgi:hypothetical protein
MMALNVINAHNRPVTSFAYRTRWEADVAAIHVRAAVENAALVKGHS